MKKYLLITKVMMFITILQSCNSTSKESHDVIQDDKHYNICLVLDGTDRLTEENCVPQLAADEILNFAKTISERGKGFLYVAYIDKNCDNNHIAAFEWMEDKPIYHGEKPGYMKMVDYKKQEKADVDKKEAYDCRLTNALGEFSSECLAIVESAYSDAVALQKNGSDVTGAINQANKLLRASTQEGIKSYIILVSDGCDNVGKELDKIDTNTELIIVNSNTAKHQYQEYVSKEYVTLKQVYNYIFS